MTNRNSHQHGHTLSNTLRPKSKLRARRNKVGARVRAEARQNALQQALAAGNE